MTHYLVRRGAGALIAVWVIGFLAYAALTFAPGDAAQTLIGENASAEQLSALRQQLGLDEPFLERYGHYAIGAVSRADLGKSLVSGRSVRDLLVERFPSTLLLTFTALGFALAVGLVAGGLAASRAGSYVDLITMGGTTLGLAVPIYWMALLLVMFFSLRLHWLPVFGSGTLAHLALPAVTLGLPTAAAIARLTRSSVLEVRGADFVRTAHSKGLHPRIVFTRHVMPNSLIAVVTLLGLSLSQLLGGAFIVETIFAWPGLGRLAVQGIFDRDVPVVMGAVLLIAPLSVFVNFLVDVTHAALDPRIGRASL